MRSLGLSAALLLVLAIPAAAREDFSVKLDIPAGSSLSDTIKLVARIKATGDVAIEKVEFLIDDQVRFSDTSTPYEYEWDTLEETEGTHTIGVTAFDVKGKSQKSKVSITIDNELSKGAEFHANKALEAYKAGDADTAMRYARRALKVDPKVLGAARVRAAMLAQDRNFLEAAKVLEGADFPENETDARMELVAYYVHSGDMGDSSENILKAAAKAIEVYKKVAAIRVAQAGTDLIKKGDMEFAARDYPAALRSYQKAAQAADAPMSTHNRLVLGLIYANRIREAKAKINSLEIEKTADVVTRSLKALIMLRERQFKEARDLVQDGVENGILSSTVVAAYADLSLRQRRRAAEEAANAAAMAPGIPEVRLLAGFALEDAFKAMDMTRTALELNPSYSEVYSFRGYQSLAGRGAKRLQAADALFEFALKYDPENVYALLGNSLSLLGQRRPNEAEPLLTQVLKLEPNWPDVHYARALYFTVANMEGKVNDELRTASKLDPERWTGDAVLGSADLAARVLTYRYPLLLSPEALYPKK